MTFLIISLSLTTAKLSPPQMFRHIDRLSAIRIQLQIRQLN